MNTQVNDFLFSTKIKLIEILELKPGLMCDKKICHKNFQKVHTVFKNTFINRIL